MSPSECGAEVWAQVLQLTDRLLHAANQDDTEHLAELVTERGALIDRLRCAQDEGGHGGGGDVALEPALATRLIEADRLVHEVLGKLLAAAREELGLLMAWQGGLQSYAGGVPAVQARFFDRRG